VGIAQAIIHVPAVVILDEPTVGLDPIQIREIRTLIRDLGGDHSVILSTHILPEVQSTCDRVQIINKGKIVLTDTIEGLEKRMQGTSILVSFKNPPAEQALKAITGVESVDSLSVDRFRLHVQPQVDPIELLVESSVKQKWGLRELSQEKVSLEEVFVDITRTEHLSHEADQPVTEEQT
jgi:ABC-2 type transport system ATP-binding protein